MKKYITLFITLICVFTFCIGISVNAEEKAYTIKSAVFEMQVNEDGSVDVVENWTVNYLQGEFTRFYKNIYLNVPKDEEFDIAFKEVKIDSKNCTLTTKTNNRLDYTYALIEGDDTLRYEVYVSSKDETRTYQISYTLQNVIKHVDNDYYLFKYRLLPKGYKSTIEDFKVRIVLPQNTKVGLCEQTSGLDEVENNIIQIKAQNVSDLYKVCMELNGDNFDEFVVSSNISKYELSNETQDLKNLGIAVSAVIFILVSALVVAIILESRENRKFKQLMEDNPNLLYDICNKWSKRLSPTEFVAKMCHNTYLVLLVYFADLAQQNIIQFSDDYKHLTYSKNVCKESLYFEIWNILEDCRIFAEKSGYIIEDTDSAYILPTAYFEKYFQKFKYYNRICSSIAKLSKKTNIDNKEFNKDRRILFRILHMMQESGELPVIKYSELINAYGENHWTPLYYCVQKDLNTCMGNEDMSTYLTLLAITSYNLHQNNDSMACIGCSACSGCGGCGGAD